MLPLNNIPVEGKRGSQKLHPTDAMQNFGCFIAGQNEDANLVAVSYDEVLGYDGKSLGFGVRTEIARKPGDMLPLLVWGTFTTEEKWVQNATELGEPTDFPATPGVFALQTPYEKTVCVMSENCPARYVNDSKGVPNAKPNIKFVQHRDPRELFYDPLKGLHLLLQAEVLEDIQPGEQLFSAYGASYWELGAAISRATIDEAALEAIGDTPDPEDVKTAEDDEDTPLGQRPKSQKTPPSTPSTPSQKKKPTNASTLTQGTTDSETDAGEPAKKRKPSQSRPKKQPAKITKSGGGKNISLADLPQTESEPSEQPQTPRRQSPATSARKTARPWEESKTPRAKKARKDKSTSPTSSQSRTRRDVASSAR